MLESGVSSTFTQNSSTSDTIPTAELCDRRRKAAKELTDLLQTNESLSYIRLGDGEVYWMHSIQNGKPPPKYSYIQNTVNVEVTRSTSGLEVRHYTRFVKALEGADYLDYCDNIPYVRGKLPNLRFARPKEKYKNQSSDTSNIIFEWTLYELHAYLRGHKCLFVGAESSLFKALCQDSRYLHLASDIIPAQAQMYFHQVREDGRNYSENLDLIKKDIIRVIGSRSIDTVFISLSTGAKILCYEIAKESKVRAVDFGSMLRALTYSGTPGYQAIRNLHNPFLFRVPMKIYMPALQRAAPEIDFASLIVRAHAQALLDLQNLKPLRFNPSDATRGGEVNISTQNLQRFKQSVGYYNRTYRARALLHKDTRKLHRAFVFWRLKKGLGISGAVFLSLVKLKGELRRLQGRLHA